MKGKWTRRDFLRNGTLASLLAPVAAYWPDLSEAAETAQRRNMVLVFFPNGKCRENVFVKRTAGGFDFGPGFAPYEPFKRDAIVFEQYAFQDFINAEYRGDHGGHIAPGGAMFSGEVPYARNGAAEAPMAPTIDQIVAWDYLQRGVISDPLRRSLNVHIAGGSFRLQSVFCNTPADYALNKVYASPLTPVSMIDDPRVGFDRMFGGFAASAGSTTARLWAFGKSVLDVPAAELGAIRSYLPADGNNVLDEHLQHLRDLEQSLNQEPAVTPLAPPQRPSELALNATNHEAVVSQWVKIVEASFRFDRTRIATLQFGGIASRFAVPSLGLGFVGDGADSNSGSDHHSYTHWEPTKVDLFLEWYAQRVVELLTALRGDGTSARPDILADSAVLVGWEFGRNHDAHDVPVLLFGQGGGYFKTGQILTYGNAPSENYKHHGTLLAMCHAMGVTGLTRVGNPKPEYQRGVIEALRA